MNKAVAIFVICCAALAFADNPHITKLIELIDVAISSPADGDILAFNSTSGKWQNTQPVVTDTSNVVLRYQQEGITGAFPETQIFVPSEDGMYRVNAVITDITSEEEFNQCGQSSGGNITVFYRGDNFNNLSGATVGNGFGVQGQLSGVVRAKAGSPLTVRVTAGTCPYSFYVVVEKL